MGNQTRLPSRRCAIPIVDLLPKKRQLAGGVGEPTSASDDLPAEELTKRGAENQLPPLALRQLLRSRSDSPEKPSHLGQNFRDLRGLRVRARDLHRGLIPVTGLPRDAVQ